MNRNPVGAGLDKLRRILIRIGDHQVHVQWYFGYFSDRLDNDGTNGDIGHQVAIHDIYVKPICPSRFNGLGISSLRRLKSADRIEEAIFNAFI
jgi:hypothetical protein